MTQSNSSNPAVPKTPTTQRRSFLKAAAATGSVVTLSGPSILFAQDKSPIKVGILHSLSGTMAISETALKNTAIMTLEAFNAKGGILGRQLEPVIVDPASNWPLFAEKARQLITQDKVSAVFGCWTSVSRKSVLPVFEELNNLLFIRSSTKAKSSRKTCFIPAPRRTNRRSQRWST